MNTDSIGEMQVTPPVMNQVTPDVVSPQGKQELFSHLASATVQKELLDFIFKGIADKIEGEFSSRIKDPRTVVQKIAQKRLQGREYGVGDINDAYGSRITVKKPQDIDRVKKMVHKAEELGIIKINKSELVDTDYHKSWHIDFKTDKGTSGELQILTPQEEANSVVNHDLRAVFGEDMPQPAKNLADLQAKKVKDLPNDKAHALAQAVVQTRQSSGNNPLDPRVLASLVQKA